MFPDWLTHIFAYDSTSPLLFTQFYFWAFFALVYVLFAIIVSVGKWSNGKRLMRNTFLLFASLFFYYKTSGLFVLILLFVTLSDFLIAKRIYGSQQRGRTAAAKAWLVTSVVIDLGLLCYFKYPYFLTNMVNDLFGTQVQVFDVFAWIGNGFSKTGRFSVDSIMLPVGISFYIFQVISYTSDVYHDRVKPVDNILDYGFYVSFFPQLVAGPIVRASEFVPQLYREFSLSRRQLGIAVFWILNGLTKKLVLSDYLAVNFVDRVFDNPLLYSGFENLSALFFYSMQVYADFSGYTDIAIGVAMLMGFYLPKNFNSPYKAPNPHNFWKRWHISLSRWLQTYLYIPLGGNRRASFGTYFWIVLISVIALILTGSWIVTAVILGIAAIIVVVALLVPDHRKKLYANLNSFITMLLGGLWHGASWNFMIWGGLNGIGIIVFKFWRDMSWHWRMFWLTLSTATFVAAYLFTASPILRVAAVAFVIVWAVSLLRYAYYLICRIRKREASAGMLKIGQGWAILLTFVFITFTRLFFRSGSNLDPATANQQAWETAVNMLTQIGSSWNLRTVTEVFLSYVNVYVFFVVGMLVHWLPDKFKRWYRVRFAMLPLPLMTVLVVLAVFILYQFVTADLQAFIYFQF